jgi:hypothetical protein
MVHPQVRLKSRAGAAEAELAAGQGTVGGTVVTGRFRALAAVLEVLMRQAAVVPGDVRAAGSPGALA